MARTPRNIGEPERTTAAPQLKGGRQVMPRGGLLAQFPFNYIPRRAYARYDITKFENSKLSALQMLSLLADMSPDISLALWNYMRLGTSGFTATALDRDGQADDAAQQVLNDLINRMNPQAGGIQALVGQLFASAYIQGAVCGELALTETLRDVDDFYPVDPSRITAGLDENQKVRWYWNPWTGQMPVPLNSELFWYVPVDSFIDDPYGRPPAAPVLQEIWFDICIMNDLRKVVHNQAWPRLDIKVLMEGVVNAAPPNIRTSPEAMKKWLEDHLKDIITEYNSLAPDDSFVHYDAVEVGNTQGAAVGKLLDATQVIRVIERRMTKALKMLPVLMGINETSTETHGTVQWKIFVAGLESIQAPVCSVLSSALTRALEVMGLQARVVCEFEKLQTTDRMADAQAKQLEIKNAVMTWLLGGTDWAGMVQEITGQPPAPDAEEPDIDPAMFRAMLGIQVPEVSTGNPAQDPELDRVRAELTVWAGED